MIRKLSVYGLGLLLAVLLTNACSDKKNLVGDSSNSVPKVAVIPADSLFDYYYSYEDSVRNYFRSDKLLIGDFQDNSSITLLRFANLPDSNAVIVSDAELTLTVHNHHNSDGREIRFGLIKQLWNQYNATWDRADVNEPWNEEWSSLDNIEVTELSYTVSGTDSLITVLIPLETISNFVGQWISAEPLSYGLAVYTENGSNFDESYLSIKSRETAYGPSLTFDYRATEIDTAVVAYNRVATMNCFINSVKPQSEYHLNTISIGNIPPKRTVAKLNISEDFFDLEHVSNFKQITINKAELILFSKDNKHFSESFFQFTPYLLQKEYFENENTIIPYTDFLAVDPTFSSGLSSTADSVAVNITTLVQSFVSNIHENRGIIITSTKESYDNSYLEFFSPTSAEPHKRPYLRIIYSLPPFE